MRILSFVLLLILAIPASRAETVFEKAADTDALVQAIEHLDALDVRRWLLSLEQTEIYLKLTREAEPDADTNGKIPVGPSQVAAVRAGLAAAFKAGGAPAARKWLAGELESGGIVAWRVLGKKGDLRVTRYFSARVEARRKKEPPFTRALYRLPPDSMRVDGKLPTKQEIHAGVLEGKVPAVAWLTPASEAELHMEGSGILVFPDGTESAVNYEGNNGRAWGEEDEAAKARLKAEFGKVPWEYWPRFKQRHTFHRELKLEEFRHLKLQAGQFLGFDRPFLRKMPVTEGLSCAMDPGLFPSGGVALLISSRKGDRRARLVKMDDQGAAFIGRPDKIDLFWGSFTKQELKAGKREDGTPLGSFPDWGNLYFLAGAKP